MSRAADLAHRLGQEAEAVCRTYLPNGRRQGHYWHCGDVHGTPGQSLYVHLSGSRAGKWTDAATGEHGDLLDLIALNQNIDLRAALEEARLFLSLPRSAAQPTMQSPVPSGSPEAARKLFAATKPLRGTVAERYLQSRGLATPADNATLRFHPRCYYRTANGRQTWPALIAAVTDADGTITGVHRTWLDPDGGKAPVAQPRRALGQLLGNGVRFGTVLNTLTVCEGIETALALRTVMPTMPIIAALSATHLAALIVPSSLQQLYVAIDKDEAGRMALRRLQERLICSGVEIHELVPCTEDFNADLLTLGMERFREWIEEQVRKHAATFLNE